MKSLKKYGSDKQIKGVVNAEFRDRDILHSLADISKAKRLYMNQCFNREGIYKTVSWWLNDDR